MAKLGDVFLDVVYGEDRDKRVRTTDKPIEGGFSIVDHVEKEPVKLKISGVCTGIDAETRLLKLEQYAEKGERLAYVGRYSLKDALIESISTTKDIDVADTAYKFDIQLKQVIVVRPKIYKGGFTLPGINISPTPNKPPRNSKVPSMPPTDKGKQQPIPTKAVKKYHTVAKGETLSRIAQRYYGSGTSKYYMIIYEANKATIGGNPNLIRPGQRLLIP